MTLHVCRCICITIAVAHNQERTSWERQKVLNGLITANWLDMIANVSVCYTDGASDQVGAKTYLCCSFSWRRTDRFSPLLSSLVSSLPLSFTPTLRSTQVCNVHRIYEYDVKVSLCAKFKYGRLVSVHLSF